MPVVYRYLRVSKTQLKIFRLKVFLEACFKSAIGFFSTKAQTSTTDSKCVKFIYLIADRCIQWGDYDFNRFVLRTVLNESHGQIVKVEADKSAVYRILSIGRSVTQSWPSKTILCSASSCLGSILNRSCPLDRRISNKMLSKPIVVCKFPTAYSDMCSNSKARLSGLASSTHAPNGTPFRLAVGDLVLRLP